MKKTLVLVLAVFLMLGSALVFRANAEEEYEWELHIYQDGTYYLFQDDEPVPKLFGRLTTMEDTDELLVVNECDKKFYIATKEISGYVQPHSKRVLKAAQGFPFMLKQLKDTPEEGWIDFKYIRAASWELIIHNDETLSLLKDGKLYADDFYLHHYPVEILANEILVTNHSDMDFDLEGPFEKNYVEKGMNWKYQICAINYDIFIHPDRRAVIFRQHVEHRKGNASSSSFRAGDCPEDFHILIRSADENGTLEGVDFLTGLYNLVGVGISPELLTDFFGEFSLTDDGTVKFVPSAETLQLLNSLPAGTYELMFDSKEEESAIEPISFTVTEPGTVPATGDGTPVVLYGAAALACAAAWALSNRRRA